MNSQTATTISNINIQNSVEDLILVLNDKEKNVLTKRFSLDNKSKETLEKIWWRFNITRERVRQIENNALNKLKRVVKSSNLSELNKRAEEIILNEWWVILEEKLISSLLNELKDNKAVDWNLIKLSLSINWEICSNQRWSELKKFWKFNEVKNEDIDKINAAWYNILKEKWDLINHDEITSTIISLNLFHNKKPTSKFISSCLSLENRISETEWNFWLMEWGFVNPKSIKDKAKIILEKNWEPMHFIDIANKIAEVWFNKKSVTNQAVHNELIKYNDFVLMWRWLYWLKQWWLISWTISDVVESIIDKHWEPMKKRDIIDEVLKIREVKIWTISLNLQKNPRFVRFWRAVYWTKAMLDD